MVLRAMMRYRYFYGTFTRATSKSFLAIISQYLACMFLPRSKRFVVSQYKKASLSITKQKLEEIWTYWPILKNEILTLHMSNDYIEIIFKNQSVLQILSLTASSRGQRATGGVVEEAALVDGDTLAEVIIPMMNVPRPHGAGGVNPTEPHSQQIYIKILCHYMETYNRKPPELLENLLDNQQPSPNNWEGSTTIHKEYIQANGSGRPRKGEDIV